MEQERTGNRVHGRADGATIDAPDGSIGGPVGSLSQTSTAALGRLLRAFGERQPLDGHLRDAASLVARDAHRQGLTAAQMIVVTRAAWVDLDDLRPLIPDDDVRALASRVISRAIEEFYVTPRDGRSTLGVADEQPRM
jgi:hypothetical protein